MELWSCANSTGAGSWTEQVAITDTPAGSNVLSSTHLFSTVFYYLFSVLGITGNGLTIAIILNSREMLKRYANIMILNQSVADLFTAVILLLIQIIPGDAANLPDNAWGRVVCRLWVTRFFLWAGLQVSTNNLVAITIERYFEIVHAIKHRVSCTVSKTMVAVSLTWLVGIFCYLGDQVWLRFEHGNCQLFATQTPRELTLYGCYTIILQFLLPVVVFSLCYTRMILALRSNAVGNASTSNAAHKMTAASQRARDNLIKTLLLVVLMFLICWAPSEVVWLLFCFGFDIDMESWWYNATVALSFFNCCVNPVIYMFNWKKFQVAARQMLPCAQPAHLIGQTTDKNFSINNTTNA